ncbi:MAG: 2,3-diketo-5-methylthiopentyl-1-phosphate enolase, partial [Gammaproteobacteria bacterium]|nr:2,3-diketo-5-methylthiopentyl-1-phosphate enolase [Gammaproteobacteria bacterium]
ALALAPDHGIDYALVLGRLMRHAGADVVLHPARFGSLPFSAADESRVITALTDSDDHWPAVFPGPSAGIKPAIVPALLADYGRDLVINAGSAIFDAATGPKAAVESFFAAMDA